MLPSTRQRTNGQTDVKQLEQNDDGIVQGKRDENKIAVGSLDLDRSTNNLKQDDC